VKRSFGWLLVAALLVVQMLGLAHRVTHAGHGQPAAAERGAVVEKTTVAPAAKGFFAVLFAGHTVQGDCDAFDHISHADGAAASTVIVAAEPLPAAPVVFHAAWHLAVQAHGFLARGPPDLA
jgi:hypothetical protein